MQVEVAVAQRSPRPAPVRPGQTFRLPAGGAGPRPEPRRHPLHRGGDAAAGQGALRRQREEVAARAGHVGSVRRVGKEEAVSVIFL